MSASKDSRKVAATVQRLYAQLPDSVAPGPPVPKGEEGPLLRTFVQAHVPKSDRKELESELKKTVVLGKQKGKKKFGKKQQEQRRRNGKLLTAREKRGLGLFKLPRKGLKYQDLEHLNSLWLQYIEGLVDFSKWRPGDESFQVRLCRADYHGAHVKVTRARNKEVVGTEGLVAMETRNTFKILGRDNVLRTVPKNHTSFTFRASEDFVFTVGGSSMMMKPSDRAVKKWKAKGPMDL